MVQADLAIADGGGSINDFDSGSVIAAIVVLIQIASVADNGIFDNRRIVAGAAEAKARPDAPTVVRVWSGGCAVVVGVSAYRVIVP